LFTGITRKDLIEIVAVLGGLFLMSWIILAADLDILVQQRLFDQDRGWIHGDSFFWRFLYDHGPKPGLILGIGAVLVFLLSFLVSRFIKYRKKALFLSLVLIFGAGIAVEAFKGVTARPRPRHVDIFQGDNEFLPVFSVKAPGSGESLSAGKTFLTMIRRLVESKGRYSFPSGHAAIAFYLMAPFFIFRSRRKGLAVLFLTGGVFYGLFVGGARMAQGGHFLSDVIWSGGVVYLSCWFFCHLTGIRSEAGDFLVKAL
jgi:lipid A 4'-phosphatase